MPSILYALFAALAVYSVVWGLIFGPLGGTVYLFRSGARRGSALLARTPLGKWALSHARWPGVQKYAPLVLILAVGAVAAVAAGFGFAELSLRVIDSTSAVNRVDNVVWTYFGGARQNWMTILFRTITQTGGNIGGPGVVAVVVGLLLVRKERASALYVLVAAVGGNLLNVTLKAVFARSRPDLTNALALSDSYSFPSGHAMSSFIIFGAVAYIVSRESMPWRYKSAVLAGAITMIVLVGMSRVYLGVHWTSDIVGGWGAGIVWLATVTAAFELLLRIRQRRRGERASSAAADVPDKPEPENAPVVTAQTSR